MTIEYVPEDVVRLIPQERGHQRTVEQIVHVSVPQVAEETAEVVQTIPQELISKRIIDRIFDVPGCEATPSMAHPDGTKDVGCSSDSALRRMLVLNNLVVLL